MMKPPTAFSSNAAGTVVKDGSTRAAAQARYRLRPSRIVDSSHESVIGCVRPCARTSATSWLSSTGFDGDWDLPRSRVLSGCGVVVLGLELNGRDKADLAVKAAVIEPVDVLGDRDLQVVDGPPRALVADEFGLEQAVERLGHGVVIRVALAAHGGDRAGLEQALGVADGDVL